MYHVILLLPVIPCICRGGRSYSGKKITAFPRFEERRYIGNTTKNLLKRYCRGCGAPLGINRHPEAAGVRRAIPAK